MNSDLRLILANNIQRLVETERSDSGPVTIHAWAIRHGVSTRLIDRMVKGEHAVTLTTLEVVAKACSVEPWQLLHPDLELKRTERLSLDEKDIAFIKKLRTLLEV